MKIIENEKFEGERPLFKSVNVEINDCEFLPGESAVKESENIGVKNSRFYSKYPFWNNKHVKIYDSYFSEDCRAAIWYTDDVLLEHCKVDAPKIFRDAKNITIRNSAVDTGETLWDCDRVKIADCEFKGNYLLLHSKNIELTNFNLDGNYSFQHVKKGIFRNCMITSKDAFWNSEDITVYDSVLNGEYLGWYSQNLRLVNCKITGTQPLCYAEHLILENCEMTGTDLCFEYSTVKADIINCVDSIKNPKSGVIKAKGIKQIILDDPKLDYSLTEIITEGKTDEI